MTLDPALYVVQNEVNPSHAYHCDALTSRFQDAHVVDYPAGDRVPIDDADGVVLTGSTAGVYEADTHPWIDEQEALVRRLIDRSIPTLGVCFGHQIVHSALGGTVEHVGTRAGLVEARFETNDPLFEGVSPIVVSLHGDVVVESGRDMTRIASADHAHEFGSRHTTAPLWTVQFHPELSDAHRTRMVTDFEWTASAYSFADVDADQLFANFRRLVTEAHER